MSWRTRSATQRDRASRGASLRGLGSNSTLILLNGRRMSVYAFDGGAVNLQQIPFAAIERVEVLRDGASAIYGAGAGRRRDQLHHAQGFCADAQVYGGAFLHGGKGGERITGPTSWPAMAISPKIASTSSACCRTPTQNFVKARDRDFARTALRPDISRSTLPFSREYVHSQTRAQTHSRATSSPPTALRNPYCIALPRSNAGCRDESIHRCVPEHHPWDRLVRSDVDRTRCRYDYLSQIDVLPDDEDLSDSSGRATLQLDPDQPVAPEASWAKQKSTFRISQTPAYARRGRAAADAGNRLPLLYPAGGPYYPGDRGRPSHSGSTADRRPGPFVARARSRPAE